MDKFSHFKRGKKCGTISSQSSELHSRQILIIQLHQASVYGIPFLWLLDITRRLATSRISIRIVDIFGQRQKRGRFCKKISCNLLWWPCKSQLLCGRRRLSYLAWLLQQLRVDMLVVCCHAASPKRPPSLRPSHLTLYSYHLQSSSPVIIIT